MASGRRQHHFGACHGLRISFSHTALPVHGAYLVQQDDQVLHQGVQLQSGIESRQYTKPGCMCSVSYTVWEGQGQQPAESLA